MVIFARGAYIRKLREGTSLRPFEPDPVNTGVGKRCGPLLSTIVIATRLSFAGGFFVLRFRREM